MHDAAGGSVDIQSVTEASLRIASCSGAVKLGKIKASSADVITEGTLSLISFRLIFLSTFVCLSVNHVTHCADVSTGFPACLGYLRRTSAAAPRPAAAAAAADSIHMQYS